MRTRSSRSSASSGTRINPVTGGTPGPLHNQIPQPDRSTDNITIWAPDFTQAYYTDLLFDDRAGENSMRNFYKEQSSNRYTVNGEVTNWVQVPFNEARYGTNLCGSNVCSTVWAFVNSSADAWAGTMSTGDLNAKLAKYDVWDRYDSDGDGNFNEPDGYIDHFQSIHAGVGEETGGGAQGANAIWSHRWYAYFSANGPDGIGPHGFGGVRIGDSNYWIGDYTIEPENGGVGVFSHEFAHDLGLPDEYDTSGNTGGAENGTGFWTLMSQGSYGNNGSPAEGIGDRPFHMNAWDKLQLGWLDYTAVGPGGKQTSLKLGPSEATTKQDQAVIVVLPEKPVDFDFGAPAAGSKFYYSGSADDLDTTMTRSVTLPAGTPSLNAQIRTNIETDWDYAYVTVNGTPIPTNLSVNTNPNGNNLGNGITGPRSSWTALSASLTAYAGQTVTIGFRYKTDAAQQGQPGASGVPGFQVDEIAIGGQPTDGAETDAGWTFTPKEGGFHVTGQTVTRYFFNAYVAENKQYLGYDAGLRTGPYNFGDVTIGPNWAERFPYQDGLLVWYWDNSFGDNNVGEHPGGGLILPVDANPAPLHWANGSVMRPRLQSFDATFTTQATDAITVHNAGVAVTRPVATGRVDVRRQPELLGSRRSGRRSGERPLPGRVEQRQGAEHGHLDAGHQRDARWLHAGAGDAAGEVADRTTELRTGGGDPARPRSPKAFSGSAGARRASSAPRPPPGSREHPSHESRTPCRTAGWEAGRSPPGDRAWLPARRRASARSA